ncbi:MAG: hypothetical protein P1U67_04460 [Alcanivoracaceae bacterium]|nr:hypothetical protein [Alcanivoracaceae bacterium]
MQLDKNWLMQYDILRLVKQCQRLIQAEFGEKPALTDSNLRNLLADFAGRSRSRSLQHLYGEIRLALIVLEGEDDLITDTPLEASETHQEKKSPPQRMYRGQPVAAPAEQFGTQTVQKITPSHADLDATPRSKTITYRGKTLRVA